MRRWVCLVLLLLTAACHKAADAPTATNLDDINLGDTVEDPAYAAPGEALARTVSASAIGEMVPVVSMQTIDFQLTGEFAYGTEYANNQEPRRLWLSARVDF